MITECKCPKCGKIEPYFWEFKSDGSDYEDDTHYIDYDINCNCGCKFRYTEWYKLNATEIEIIS